nr:hypothetical protein [Desulfobacterales bacterium]
MPKQKVFSVQPRFKMGDPVGGWAWFSSFANWATTELPQYGSARRDIYTSCVWQQEPILAGIIGSFADKIAAMPYKVTGPRNLTIRTANTLHNAEKGQGFPYYISMGAIDWLSCDKGFFTEKGRGRPRSIKGPVLGIQQLDATRMVYMTPEDGGPNQWVYFPQREDPIFFPEQNILQMIPSPTGRDRYRRNGLCAVSRLHDMAKLMVGYLTYHRERIGDLPPEIIAILNNMDWTKFESAYKRYKTQREQKENHVWPGVFWLGGSDPANPIDLSLHHMKTLPESFSMMEWAELWVKTISVNVGQDVGEYWLIQHSGATKAMASIQDVKGKGKGPGRFVHEHELRMNQVVASVCHFEYDRRDDEQDAARAEILAKNVNTLATLSTIGASGAK